MNIVKNYLKMLNEAKSYKDDSMPNPYDYQSIELDERVTRSDLRELDKFRKKMRKFEDPELAQASTTDWLYNIPKGEREWKKDRIFTIVDGSKRVGIVVLVYTPYGSRYHDFIWSSWIPGFNYATRGIMKMLEQVLNEKNRKYEISKTMMTNVWFDNIPSRRVAEKLKMVPVSHTLQKGESVLYRIRQPFWWLKK